MQLAELLDAPSTARICADGCLVAEVFAARTGLQDYRGAEVDPEDAHGLRDKAVVKIYRPESEVFSADSLASYAAAPVTVNHPSVMVDASNWKQYGVGEIHGDIVRDGQRVKVPVIVRDAAAVTKAQTTHKQLSMGYSTHLVFPQDGKHPDGTACDAYQTDLKINHIALVPAARGGPELRIVDERPQEPPMKIKIGDAEVDATNGEAVRIAVDGLNTKLGTLTADNATLKTSVEAKDGEIAGLTAKLADATDPAKQAARDAARAAVIASAQLLKPGITVDGKSDIDIKREAVAATKVGDAAKDMPEATLDGAFLALTSGTAPTDPVRDALKGGFRTIANDADVRNLARAAQY